MKGRRESREVAFQLLYHLDLVQGDTAGETERFWQLNREKRDFKPFADLLAGKVLGNLDKIDHRISSASRRWSLKRMDSVSRCLLRLGACEIHYFPDTPPEVAINEAVELAKRFGSKDTPAFVNGILDNLQQEDTSV
jgi:N utilization substance protein B